MDQNGDAFVTLQAIPDNVPADLHELQSCLCIKQALACTRVRESYWSIPYFCLGGSQKNVYFSMSRDRFLIAKLQNCHADVSLAVPIFCMKEPWVHFENADQ